jgi:unsaturated chondroitin disaccharide hydrolase
MAGRYVKPGNYIQAWGRMHEPHLNFSGLAIIDCLMNLPLLFWAHQATGETRFLEAALGHADTARKYFLRPDGSTLHAFRFDPSTGAPLRPDNDCGFSVDSGWARSPLP